MSMLEDRYRRLLAFYPVWHRQRYQAEMLTTLMDGASEQQRTPRWRESMDLLWNAMRLRFNRDSLPRGRDPRWATAAGIFAVLGAMTLSAIYIMEPAGRFAWEQRIGHLTPWPTHISWEPFALAGAWFLIAIIALVGWRKVAAVLAWAAALSVAGWHLAHYNDNPSQLPGVWPLVVFGVTIAICLSLRSTERPLHQLLGRWWILFFGIAAAATGSSLWIDAFLTKVELHGDSGYSADAWGGNYPFVPGVDTVGAVPLLIYAAFLAVMIRVLVKVGAPIRRRLLTLTAVPVTMFVVVSNFYEGFAASSMRFWPTPVMMTIGQWLGLLFLPLLTLAIGVLLVRRSDTRQELIELGRIHAATTQPTQQP